MFALLDSPPPATVAHHSPRPHPRSPRHPPFRAGGILVALAIWSAVSPPVARAEEPTDAVLIPAGSFTRGSAREPDAPPQKVTLSAFQIGTTEVTIDQFSAFKAAGGYSTRRWWSASGRAWLEGHPDGAGDAARAAGRDGSHPVVAVTYFEAEAYCASVGARLPTEAEWERAACGTDDRRYPWGDTESETARWYAGGKFGNIVRVDTAPASEQAESLRSPDGLLHMAGNVWEWTADHYHATNWGGASGRNPKATPDTPWRSLRGGSYMNLPSYCSCQHREPARPDRVALTIGFRCAWDQP
ncbi:MAG TPA: hypothetical protein DFR83_28045 [Deltaproteobacteria bacterium]|nr:hypothetical protein [Deltaproteobacteria bacterium]